jgi:phage I-like protein
MVQENTVPTGDESQTENEQPVVQETPGERSFTQDDVNQINARTKREIESKYSDYADLKAQAAELGALKQAQLSETERLQTRAQEAERKADEADERIATAMIATDVKVKATQMGIVDPDAAYLLIDRGTLSYDATAGVAGVEQALTQLLEEKPYLKGAAIRSPNINAQGGQVAPAGPRLTEDQREAARLMGISEDDYAKGL